jgi:diketogulonate reductase-like aldo/keto reductase
MAPPGRKTAPRPSSNSRCAWVFAASTPPTNGAITSKLESARDWQPPIAPEPSHAPISFYRRNSPTGFSVQVAQSLASSLEHLGTDHVDSYVLHGPSSGHLWTDADAEVWEAMTKERDAGRTRLLGVSNVSLRHLEQMIAVHSEVPAFVQNRCYARLGWDRDIRLFCREHKITYQGFSLLTANPEILHHSLVARLAANANATPAQIVFAFARALGMLPLTGTSNPEHMKQDLASYSLTLPPEAVRAIEGLAG